MQKPPFCSSNDDAFYYQLIKNADGGWRWEKYAYVIDVVVEYPTLTPLSAFADAAIDLDILDTVQFNRSIAWGDVDGDDFQDLLWDGRLYLNREGKVFERYDGSSELHGSPKANLFLDANNDGDLDILFLGSHDTADARSRLFLGNGGMEFRQVDLEIPPFANPTSFSVADVDQDGYLDVFVGQSVRGEKGSDRLLLNSGGGGFTESPERISLPFGDTLAVSYGSQFIDVDHDNDPDLYVARRYPGRSLILYNDGTGRFAPEAANDGMTEFGPGAGGDWKDFDNDGDIDLLYPRLIHPFLRKNQNFEGSTIYNSGQMADGGLSKLIGAGGGEVVEYEERHAGGMWGDVNNDGLLDALFATFGDCRFAELYVQNPDHTFSSKTFDYGLHWSSAGEDGVWVDYDNDGWLDLSVVEWNRIRIYRNPGDGGHSRFVEIDLQRPSGGPDVGAVATVYTGNVKISRDVTIGRGILMGDSPRLHYGLGANGSVDSVIVQWSNDSSEVFTDVKTNAVNRLVQGSARTASASHGVEISAVPNPFSDQLHIYYSLPHPQHVRLEIYNQVGKLVTVLIEEEVSAGDHSIVWHAADKLGEKVPAGTYLYRLSYDGGEVSGRVVLTR